MGDALLETAVNYGLKLHPNSLELKSKTTRSSFFGFERYVQARQLINELEPACSETTDYLVCCAKYFLTTEILESL